MHLKHRNALGYCLVSLLTAGGERIFSTTVFQCPCSAAWNLPYGLVLLLVPALALFLLGCMLKESNCGVLTGCCSQGCRVGLRKAWVCVNISVSALVTPLIWVSMALLGGTFYECAASGTKLAVRYLCGNSTSSCSAQLPLVPCQQAQAPDVKQLQKELQRELMAQSQVGRPRRMRSGGRRGTGFCGADGEVQMRALAPDSEGKLTRMAVGFK